MPRVFVLTATLLACASRPVPTPPVRSVPADRSAPFSADPSFDFEHPPSLAETHFEVEGARVNAIVYQAQGAGPHPTAILLHGFPGNEKNLDIAQALRRDGWNVVFFHYRGMWGSGGDFSFVHIIEDASAVVRAVLSDEFRAKHRIDRKGLTLIGHSMGAFAALIAGAEVAEVKCVVAMAGPNMGGSSDRFRDPARAEGFANYIDSWRGAVNGKPGMEQVKEIVENADRFDTFKAAARLATKGVFLIAGKRDQVIPFAKHHTPMVEALQNAGAKKTRSWVVDNADHAFSGQRLELAREIKTWLNGCAGR